MEKLKRNFWDSTIGRGIKFLLEIIGGIIILAIILKVFNFDSTDLIIIGSVVAILLLIGIWNELSKIASMLEIGEIIHLGHRIDNMSKNSSAIETHLSVGEIIHLKSSVDNLNDSLKDVVSKLNDIEANTED